MRKKLLLITIVAFFANGAIAQEQGLRSLETGFEASAWEAVGRIDIGGKGFCSGALIAPDVVLTAAHCLFDKTTGEPVDHAQMEFLAGWRNGRASAYRKVRQTAIHRDYQFGDTVSPERVRSDLALLKLVRPIQNTTVIPFGTSTRPARGDKVGVVSYARKRSEAPSLQEVCDVLGHQEGVLITSCSVDYGASGAPIFSFSSGQAQIVSVVSAMAEVEGTRVSLGTELAVPLQELRVALEDNSGLFRKALPTVSQGSVEQSRQDTGAKFIRPLE